MADLSAQALRRGLATRFIGRDIVYLEAVPSTMEAAWEEARHGAAPGMVVVAGEQTGGRGRRGRTWIAPPGNVSLSVVLRPRLTELPRLVMLASLAVVRAVRAAMGVEAEISWPNDVLIGGRKVCGILVENEVRGREVRYAVVGIGINANLDVSRYPEIASRSTSLCAEVGGEVGLVGLIRQLIMEIDGLYPSLEEGESIYLGWRDKLVTLGELVEIDGGGGRYQAVAESVGRDGGLKVRLKDGGLKKVFAGEVTLIR